MADSDVSAGTIILQACLCIHSCLFSARQTLKACSLLTSGLRPCFMPKCAADLFLALCFKHQCGRLSLIRGKHRAVTGIVLLSFQSSNPGRRLQTGTCLTECVSDAAA